MQNIVIHIITQNDTICAGGIAYLFYSGEITKAVSHEKVVNYLESHTSTLNSIYIPIVVSASQSKSQGHFPFFCDVCFGIGYLYNRRDLVAYIQSFTPIVEFYF